MLKESEWKMINNILLELYMTESIEDLASKFFKIIKTLIQYTSGYMLLLDKNKNIIIDICLFKTRFQILSIKLSFVKIVNIGCSLQNSIFVHS